MFSSYQANNDLRLSRKGKLAVETLLQDPALERTSISGVGEPLENAPGIAEILSCSNGGLTVEIITSAFWAESRIRRWLDHLAEIAELKKDFYTIRISTDSFHAARIRRPVQAAIIKYALETQNPRMKFAFRSLLHEKAWTRKYLLEQLDPAPADIQEIDPLQDQLAVDRLTFPVIYKNIVHPRAPLGLQDLDNYIALLSDKYRKPFTLGHLHPGGTDNGLDVTVTADGDVMLYGAEIKSMGNIHERVVTFGDVLAEVESDPILHMLYAVPMARLLANLNRDAEAHAVIVSANNPYWIVKEIWTRAPAVLMQAAAELGEGGK